MQAAHPHILTINGGSSSIKFALFARGASLRRILQGGIERMGSPQATLQIKGLQQGDISQPITAPNPRAAAHSVMDWLEGQATYTTLQGIGHRVVHGGPNYYKPEQITPKLLADLHKLRSFAPEQMPAEILLLEAFRERFPHVPQWACFDTAFHHDLPRVAKLLPIPRHFEALGIRRYGFHGLSYQFLLGALGRLAGEKAAQGRIIFAHLGNGASLAAVQEGKSVDTSMSFTPTAGVPMGSRSGDLDPGILGYLAETQGFDAKRFMKMVHFESGLLGVSESSADMQILLQQERHDIRSAEAIALFCYQVKKWIGAFAAAMGGVDTLVFAGGIGENAPIIRSRICAGLEFLGITIEERQNSTNASVISIAHSRVTVRVIRTDEELMIAKTVDHLCTFATKGVEQ